MPDTYRTILNRLVLLFILVPFLSFLVLNYFFNKKNIFNYKYIIIKNIFNYIPRINESEIEGNQFSHELHAQ